MSRTLHKVRSFLHFSQVSNKFGFISPKTMHCKEVRLVWVSRYTRARAHIFCFTPSPPSSSKADVVLPQSSFPKKHILL